MRTLLIGIHFIVITDCKSVVYVNLLKPKNAQFIRWLNTLAEYDFKVVHGEGKCMQHVDALSRAPEKKPS